MESTPHTFRPAVVDGVDAVQDALAEGMFPVLDKTVDVFAVPSAPGLNILFCTMWILLSMLEVFTLMIFTLKL